MNLALDGLPEFTCLRGEGEHLRGAISFSPSIDYMELAYDDAKAGRFSRRPFIDMVIPTLVDPSMAPPGKHVMSCFVQYAPYHLADDAEWDDARREAFGETVLDTIEERVPNIRRLILHSQVLSPRTSRTGSGCRRATSSRASSPSSSSSSTGPSRAGPAIARRCETSGCAARPRTLEEGSWGRLVVSPPSRSCARSEPAGRPDARGRERYDAIIVGAGHNGLVAAAYLAKAGLRTLVLERRSRAGGALATEEVAPGVRAPDWRRRPGRSSCECRPRPSARRVRASSRRARRRRLRTVRRATHHVVARPGSHRDGAADGAAE